MDMNIIRRKVLPAVFFSLFLLFGMTVYIHAEVRMPDVSEPATGNVFINVTGSFSSEAKDKIVNRINEIRLEAYKLGYVTKYTPVTWSSSLEKIAQLRAVEASLLMDHERPSGKEWSKIVYDNHTSDAENLAWNYDGMLKGIEQWYGEIEYYKELKKTGKTAGETAITITGPQ